jgi:cell division protein FtsQ
MSVAKRNRQPAAEGYLKRLNLLRLAQWLFALLLFALMGSGVAWGVMQLADPKVLPLKVVRIDGEFQHLEKVKLEQAISSVMHGNFFTVDLEAIRRAALYLPWVEQVTVRRIWPHTLNMEVKEQVPLARWGEQSLVNTQGVVFTPEVKTLSPDLPWLDGPPGSAKEVTRKFLDLRLRMANMDLLLNRVSFNPRRSWTLYFDKGFELKLGNAQLEERLGRFMRIYPMLRLEEGRLMKQVDLRYTNGVTVLWESKPTGTNDGLENKLPEERLGLLPDQGTGQI